MSVFITISGENGREAAFELRSLATGIVDLFGPVEGTNAPTLDAALPAPIPEPEQVEGAPKRRGRPAKKVEEPKSEPASAPEQIEEPEPPADEETAAADEPDDLVEGYAVTEEGLRAAFTAWFSHVGEDKGFENGAKILGFAKVGDVIAAGPDAIRAAITRAVAGTR